jgi:hypothetical protein
MTELSVTKAQAATRLLELIAIRLVSESIYVAAALGLADLLADTPKSIEELAKSTGVSESSLRRVLRGLVTFEVFAQDSDGRFAMAPMGEFLKREAEGSLHSAALFFGGERGAKVDELFLHCVDGRHRLADALWRQLDKLAAKQLGVERLIQCDDDRFLDPASDRRAGSVRFFVPSADWRPAMTIGLQIFLVLRKFAHQKRVGPTDRHR